MPFDIPDSWEWVRLGSIGETNIGLTYKPSDVTSDGVPVLRSNNIQNGQMDYSELLYVSCAVPERAYAHKGDILICARNGSRALVGKSAIVDADGMAFGAFMAIFRSPCNPYIQLFINSYLFRGQLEGATTTTINQVTQEMLKRQLCPLPPIQEQLRIVQKYTELQPSIAAYSNAYDKAQILSKAFPEALKKSILQEAVQGKLVPQDPSDEPAEVLLERIQAEKQRLIKEGKIKRDKHESIIFRRDNSHYEKLDGVEHCIDDELPFEIPESWAWVRLGTILSVTSGDSLTGAQMNSAGSIPVYGGNGIAGTHDKWNVCHRTLVIGRVGYYCGATHITESFAWVTDNAFITHFNAELLQMKWLKFLIDYLEPRKRASSTAQPVISGKLLYPMLAPLPPLAEQHRIVHRIEELLPLVKGL